MPRRQFLCCAGAAVLAALAGCSKEDSSAPAPAGGGASGDAARQAWETASKGHGFVVGQPMAARSLLVFFDPQCPHCATLWANARPLRDRIRMVWMPVAFISPASGPQGAALLAAPDPVSAMDLHESQLAAGQGGLELSGPPDAERLAQVQANTALWKSLEAGSVPHLVYRAGTEGPYGAQSGGLSTAQLAGLLGL